MLDIDIIRPTELGTAELTAWRALRAADPALRSPFFAPAFAQRIGELRADARVAVIRRDGALAALLPFHVGPSRMARPLGRKLADYQGAILDRAVPWRLTTVLRRARLLGLSFDHVVPGQAPFAPYVAATHASPHVLLHDGVDAYRAQQRAAGRSGPRFAARQRRRLERERGVRFVLDERSPEALRVLRAWKSAQYRETAALDVLGRPWVVDLLESLHAEAQEDLTGVLSCLYDGDHQLMAAHFGLRSGSVLHWWFPGYDAAHGRWSPGLVLLDELIAASPAAGIAEIDLGKGSESYKLRFANGEGRVGSGRALLGRGGAVTGLVSHVAWEAAARTPAAAGARRLRRRMELG